MTVGARHEGTDERYVPGHGDPTYAADSYDLVLGYTVEGNQLSGKATIVVVASTEIDRITLDLYRLRVSKVLVDGKAAAKYAHRGDKLVVRLGRTVPEGTRLTIAVTYSGSPQPMPGLDGDAGWEELADGVIVASQPHGAPSWYPCNDRPDDKATHRFEVTAPNEYTVVANGVLEERRRRASSTTWTYSAAWPMATYLATVQIGRYVTTTDDAGDVPVATVHPAGRPTAESSRCVQAFARQREMMSCFVDAFGPYPFEAYSAVVTADALEIPLEAQGLSIFGSNLASTTWDAQRLIAHEMAHQWFGNSLTLRRWSDIWLHEGFACYAEWIWSEASGGPSAHEQAVRHWRQVAAKPQDLLLIDPGPDLMFDDRVYKRGALTLHALRLTLGDDLFFGLLREWTLRHRWGSVSTDDLEALVDEVAPGTTDAVLDAWLRELRLPELPSS